MVNDKYIIAHRGYSHIAPENTKIAFDCAVLFNFDGVELDVHLTKDNYLVVIHDVTTGRVGDRDLKIKNSTLKELQQVNLGYFWKYKIAFQRILTLNEFLSLYINKFKIINIEIKTDVIHYKNIEALIYKAIQPFKNSWSKLIFSSFNFKSLEIINKIDYSLKLAFLWETTKQFEAIDKNKFKIIKYFNPWFKIYEKNNKDYDVYLKPYFLWAIKSDKIFNKLSSDKFVRGLICNYYF